MAILFVHGVNVRDGMKYRKLVAKRQELLQHYVLEPLSKKLQLTSAPSPYWGKYGAEFRWNHASLPSVQALEDLGVFSNTGIQDIELAWQIYELADEHPDGFVPLEKLGSNHSMIVRAVQRNLPSFLQFILAPFSSDQYSNDGSGYPEEAGRLEALTLIAADRVAHDRLIVEQVARQDDDEDILNLLRQGVLVELRELLRIDNNSNGQDLEVLGSLENVEVMDHIAEAFERLRGLPERVISIAALGSWRDALHSQMSKFMGDVFVYLNERGTAAAPGPIIKEVLQCIDDAINEKEKLVIVSHSMGCNIMYDILTFYRPGLPLDAWITVGGQVGQFEEIKVFKASDPEISAPQKVESLKSHVKAWFNIYDPGDVVAFKAKPIFEAVTDDVKFLTGLGPIQAHSAYFVQPSFYKLLYDLLDKVLI